MKDRLEQLLISSTEQIEKAGSLGELENIRVAFLGKKGELTAILRGMGGLAPELRPIVGQLANDIRGKIENNLESARVSVAQRVLEQRLNSDSIDVTLPGKFQEIGGLHPLNRIIEEISTIFLGFGFEICEGPEIEDLYHNFDALNIPANHPSRDEQDTFYFNPNFVLRTATSPVQIRVMEQRKPPIRIIAPGRVFRSDAQDATHSPMFHQIEGLLIDENVTFGDLKGILQMFVQELYGDSVKTRFRPHFFPFTEPSAEMDISCFVCKGKGCSVCKNEGWIEILGCGMVHPNVLKYGNIDTEKYSGFAFGMGVERMAMRRWGIDDLRLFFENDVRFLSNFR